MTEPKYRFLVGDWLKVGKSDRLYILVAILNKEEGLVIFSKTDTCAGYRKVKFENCERR